MPLFPLDLVPESELRNRLTAARDRMADQDLAAVLLTHRPDLFYFTGTAQDGWVILTMDQDPLIFIRRFLPRARSETPFRDVVPLDSVRQMPGMIRDILGRLPKTMGLSFDVVPVRDFRFLESLFPETRFMDATDLILDCRSLKSPWEIEAMTTAARSAAGVFQFIAENLSPGLMETELAGMIDARARVLGHSGKIQMRHYRAEGFSFHIMSGPAGGMAGALDSPVSGIGTCTAYPFGAGPKPIGADEPVLVDFSAMVQGYHVDESRMFCAGRMPGLARDAGEAAMEILFALKERMRPGAVIHDLFQFSMAKADQMGFSTQYLGLPGYKAGFVGHGIGLELVEPPILARGRDQELLPGMVFAVEPKLVYKDRFAAGVESVICVTQGEAEFISITPHRIYEV